MTTTEDIKDLQKRVQALENVFNGMMANYANLRIEIASLRGDVRDLAVRVEQLERVGQG